MLLKVISILITSCTFITHLSTYFPLFFLFSIEFPYGERRKDLIVVGGTERFNTNRTKDVQIVCHCDLYSERAVVMAQVQGHTPTRVCVSWQEADRFTFSCTVDH